MFSYSVRAVLLGFLSLNSKPQYFLFTKFAQKTVPRFQGAGGARNSPVALRTRCFASASRPLRLLYHHPSSWKNRPARVLFLPLFLATGRQTTATTAPSTQFAASAFSRRPIRTPRPAEPWAAAYLRSLGSSRHEARRFRSSC